MKEPEVLHEDNHIIVVNKPAGLLSQGDITGRPSLLEVMKEYIKDKYNKPGSVFLGLVHRLDRPVSGLMVFARTSKGAERLHAEFIKRDVEKFYIAITEIKPGKASGDKSRTLKWEKHESFLTRVNDKTIVEKKNNDKAQHALLHRLIISETADTRLNLIALGTGRKHQIRAQLAASGEPVYGDRKYGSLQNTGKDRILLHSSYLSFVHPTTRERLDFYSAVPDYFFEHIELTPDEVKEKVLRGIDEFRKISAE